MLGRTFLVILFFWAALTIITPILVHLSASAKPLDYNGDIKKGDIQSRKGITLLSRKSLGSFTQSQSKIPVSEPVSAPAPAPAPTRKEMPSLEPETLLMDIHLLTAKTSMRGLPTYIHAKKQI